MTKTLLVPGTQATCLSDGRGVVYNAVRVSMPLVAEGIAGFPREQWAALMGLGSTPGQLAPASTSLLAGESLRTDSVVRSPYEPLKGLTTWPYDWRADLRWNAARLVDDLRAMRTRGEAPPNLVGHSQGGLLIVLASKVAGAEFAGLARSVVLVGSPLAGTTKAAAAMLFGRDDLGKGTAGIARTMARTWPALYQMLPRWAAVVDPGGAPLPADKQLTSMGGWPEGWNEGVTQDMLDRAVAAQQMLADPLQFMQGMKVTAILGANQVTGLSITRDDAAPVEQRFVVNAQPRSGDTLVPFQITRDYAGPAFTRVVVQAGPQTRQHAELCCDNTVAAFIRSLL
jgi:pimeloyl-ACP methyl ester carboxylesterase